MRTMKVITIFFGIVFFSLVANPAKSSAEVSINIGIGVPLPRVVIHDPPAVVVVPGTYVYFAPDVGVDIFFYQGYWYRPHQGYWYRSSGYDGPWDNIRSYKVPHVVRHLPPDFRHTVRYHERIRHEDLHKNWKGWEREKHWDRHEYEQRHRNDYGQWERDPYRREAGGAHDNWRRESNYRDPDGWHNVREVRDVRDGRRQEDNQSRPRGKERHER